MLEDIIVGLIIGFVTTKIIRAKNCIDMLLGIFAIAIIITVEIIHRMI